MNSILLRVSVLIFSATGFLSAQENSGRPNIVFIMADDLGPGWVDYDDSNPEVNTPNLQRLAETGMVFSQAYAACCLLSNPRCLHHRHVSGANWNDDTHSGKGG